MSALFFVRCESLTRSGPKIPVAGYFEGEQFIGFGDTEILGEWFRVCPEKS